MRLFAIRPRRYASALAFAVIVLVAPAAVAQDRRAPTIDDLLNLVPVSGAEISPDGRQVIYTKS